MSTISIIGSGGMAAAIGFLAARAGHRVEMTSRDDTKALALAGRIGANASAVPFGTMPVGDMVILAVPYSAALEVVKLYADKLAAKILVDITNPITADFTDFLTPENSFGAQEIARLAPASAHVIKAFNTQNASVLKETPREGRTLDIFIAGDDPQAKARVSSFIKSLGFRPMDTGLLSMAQTLEHACMLCLGLMTHTVKHGNFALGVGLPD